MDHDFQTPTTNEEHDLAACYISGCHQRKLKTISLERAKIGDS